MTRSTYKINENLIFIKEENVYLGISSLDPEDGDLIYDTGFGKVTNYNANEHFSNERYKNISFVASHEIPSYVAFNSGTLFINLNHHIEPIKKNELVHFFGDLISNIKEVTPDGEISIEEFKSPAFAYNMISKMYDEKYMIKEIDLSNITTVLDGEITGAEIRF